MLRELIIAAVAGGVGYVIGVRAGFDAGVRDHVENGSRLLRKVAAEKDKFDYSSEGVVGDSEDDSDESSATRTFQ